MARRRKASATLVLEPNLQAFFFDRLNTVNDKSSRPLPKEMIYYSSMVMERFGKSENYFQESGAGRMSDKILGRKLLESGSLPKSQQPQELKDIGDTALFLCGYFSESLNRKLVDTSYYQRVGQSSYRKLDTLQPSLFDFDGFYASVAKLFTALATTIGIIAQDFFSRSDDDFLFLVSENFKVRAAS